MPRHVINQPLEELPLDELKKRRKALLGIVAVVGFVALVYALVLLYWVATGNFGEERRLAIVPLLALGVAMLPPLMSAGRIRREIERRGPEPEGA